MGGTTFQVASVWLEENGVSAKQENGEATFLPYSDGNLELEALYNGDIDVAAVWDPLGDIAEVSGKAKVLVDISKDEPFAGRYCCFYYASTKVLNENPEEKPYGWTHICDDGSVSNFTCWDEYETKMEYAYTYCTYCNQQK